MYFFRRAAFAALLATTPRLGHAGQNVWTPLGPDGGPASAVAFAPAATFAASRGAGVFRSADAGAHWTAVNAGLDSLDVTALVVPPSGDGATVFAVTGGGLYRTTDAGDTWSAVRFSPSVPLGPVLSMAADPVTPAVLWAGVAGGVYRSTDGGAVWHFGNAGLPANGPVTAIAAGGGQLLAGVEGGGVFASPDGGATWQPRNTGLLDLTVSAVARDAVAANTVYAGTLGGGVFRSTDGAATWQPDLVGLGNLTVNALVTVNRVPSPGLPDPRVYAATAGGVFRQGTGGWSSVSSGLADSDVAALAANPGVVDELLAATGAGVARTTSGGNIWSPRSDGINAHVATFIALTGNALLAGTDGEGVLRRTGASWTRIGGMDDLPAVPVRDLVPAPSNATTLYAVVGGSLYRTTGGSWNPTASVGAGLDVRAVAVDATNPNVVYAATSGGVRKSINGGGGWSAASAGLGSSDVRDLLLVPAAGATPATLYAATAAGLYRSTNGAANWSPVAGSGTFLLSVDVDPTTPASPVIYVASANAVLRSGDGGTTWVARAGGLPSDGLRAVSVVRAQPDVAFVATSSGVFATRNGGQRWSRLAGLPNPDVRHVRTDPAQPATVYAATAGNGVFALTLVACANDQQCDDGDACTLGDTCAPGDTDADATGCLRTQKECVAPNTACYLPVACDHQSGACTPVTTKPDGTACDDGNSCTIGDACKAGDCVPGPGPKCDDNDPCTVDGCGAQGQCVHTPAEGGSACTEDANPCTDDVCDGLGKCKHLPREDGSACESDANKCTAGDYCQGGQCHAGPAVVCESTDQCHKVGLCNPATGICSSPIRPSGVACEDGDYCTINDYCQLGACVAGGPRACGDAKACTLDYCDSEARQCIHQATTGSPCDDFDPCTANDLCTAEGSCRGTAAEGPGCSSTTSSHSTTTRTTTTKTTTSTTTVTTSSRPPTTVACTADAQCVTDYPCDDEQCVGGACAFPALTGFPGLTCRLQYTAGSALCGSADIDDGVARKIGDRLLRARTLVEQAFGSPKPRQKRRALRRAARLLKTIDRVIANGLHHGALSGACANQVDGVVGGLVAETRRLPSS